MKKLMEDADNLRKTVFDDFLNERYHFRYVFTNTCQHVSRKYLYTQYKIPALGLCLKWCVIFVICIVVRSSSACLHETLLRTFARVSRKSPSPSHSTRASCRASCSTSRDTAHAASPSPPHVTSTRHLMTSQCVRK